MTRVLTRALPRLAPLFLAACASLGGLSGGDPDAGGGTDTGKRGSDAGSPDAKIAEHDARPPSDAHGTDALDGSAGRDAADAKDAGVDSGPGFSITAQPSLTLQQGASASVAVNVARTGAFADAISVTVSGLPAAATTNPLTITNDTSTGELTIVVSDATPQGVSHLSIDGVAANGTISASANMDLVVRGPAGSLDALYGSGGIVSGFLTTTNFGTFDAAALDANGNVLIAIDSQLGGGQVFVIRITPDGTLDPTFGSGGLATLPNTGVAFDAIFALPTGEVELCGLSQNGHPWTDEIVRLTATGAVDTSFSPDGGVGDSIVRSDGQPYVFTLDSSGRVVETGFTGNAAGFLLTRRTATGALDSTFAASFASTIGGPGGPTVIQPDGHIVASFAATTAPYAMGLVRVDDVGNLDPLFGTNGVVPATGPGNPYALLLQSDGKLLAGGVTFGTGGNEMPGGFVARYGSTGSIDVTYGAGGVATVSAGNVFSIAEQTNDDVVAVGYPWPTGDAGAPTSDLWVERITAGGLPDVTFGSSGVVTAPVGGSGEICEGEFVAIQSDGRIVVVVATMKSQGVFDFGVVRFWP